MNYRKLLPTTDKNADIEYRLFDISLGLTIGVFLFWSVYSLFVGYTLVIKAIYFTNLMVYSLLYLSYKNGTSFQVTGLIYYSSMLIVLGYAWFPSGGISGMILHMVVLVYISGLLVLPLRSYLFFIAVSIIEVLAFAFLEIRNPGIAAPYSDALSKLQDISLSSFLMLSIIGFALYVFKSAYTRDRRQLQEIVSELEQEKEKAQAADKAKSEFLATISHEMRTPLNGIVGITELLAETPLGKEQRDMLGNLTYSSGILYSLISDVLDLTLIESGKLVLHRHEIDIRKEINEIKKLMEPRLSQKKKEVKLSMWNLKAVPAKVSGDVVRFRQVLLNLIGNAVKFTEEGEISVRTKVQEENEEQIRIHFSVSDTGRGIPEDRHAQLFNKFFKAETDSNIEGTGLGLSITKNLVEIMGGAIWFDSEPGKGSVFYFEIPFLKHVSKKTESRDKPALKTSFEDLRVLIAEDVHINQMVIRKMIENLGVSQVDIAENGEEAVAKSGERVYDIILMDIQMPVMNGVDASSQITKQRNRDKKPVIIAVTANVMKTNLEEFKEAGISDVLSKPITQENLKAIFEKHGI